MREFVSSGTALLLLALVSVCRFGLWEVVVDAVGLEEVQPARKNKQRIACCIGIEGTRI